MLFEDRSDSGRRLAKALARLGPQRPVVVGIPRGGVAVAAPVADALRAPLCVVLARKVGAPHNPELAVGAVAPGSDLILNDEIVRQLALDADALQPQIRRAREEMERRMERYGAAPPDDLRGRSAILVDDGVATGYTAEAALHALRGRNPDLLLLAVPVGAAETVERLSAPADRVLCLHTPARFYAVGQFYRRFPQVDDDQVLALLHCARD